MFFSLERAAGRIKATSDTAFVAIYVLRSLEKIKQTINVLSCLESATGPDPDCQGHLGGGLRGQEEGRRGQTRSSGKDIRWIDLKQIIHLSVIQNLKNKFNFFLKLVY